MTGSLLLASRGDIYGGMNLYRKSIPLLAIALFASLFAVVSPAASRVPEVECLVDSHHLRSKGKSSKCGQPDSDEIECAAASEVVVIQDTNSTIVHDSFEALDWWGWESFHTNIAGTVLGHLEITQDFTLDFSDPPNDWSRGWIQVSHETAIVNFDGFDNTSVIEVEILRNGAPFEALVLTSTQPGSPELVTVPLDLNGDYTVTFRTYAGILFAESVTTDIDLWVDCQAAW